MISSGAPAAVPKAEQIEREPNPVKRFLLILGPGFITGASDDDPSGIGTYAVAGAALGFAPLWTALVTFPMMAAVQFICAKVGLVLIPRWRTRSWWRSPAIRDSPTTRGPRAPPVRSRQTWPRPTR